MLYISEHSLQNSANTILEYSINKLLIQLSSHFFRDFTFKMKFLHDNKAFSLFFILKLRNGFVVIVFIRVFIF